MKKYNFLIQFVVLCAIILPFSNLLYADAAPVSCRVFQPKNSDIQIQIFYSTKQGGACDGFSVSKAGKLLYEVKNSFWTRGYFWPSADGRSVAILYNRIFGTSEGKTPLEVYHPNSSGKMIPLQDFDVLLFFRDGKKVGSYSWKEIIQRPQLVEQSISHTNWIASSSSGDYLPSNLDLVTTSFRHYQFDTITGKMILGEDSDIWKRCATIAYGPSKRERGNEYKMSPAFVAKGDKTQEINFQLSNKVSLGSDYETLCFEKKDGKFVATERIPYLLNGLTVSP